MTKLSDILSDNTLKNIAENTIKKGDVYRIRMNREDGIIPKNGADSRNKFFVVLGFDSFGNAYGGVIVNSKNAELTPGFR